MEGTAWADRQLQEKDGDKMTQPILWPMVPWICSALLAAISVGATQEAAAEEYLTGIEWSAPPVVTPGKTDHEPASDATILFGGQDLSRWNHDGSWTVVDGAIIVGKGALTSKDTFGNCQLHIEWSAPTPARGEGQDRGNSGVFLMGRYEIQVLDSFENVTYHDGQAGAIYKQTPPAVNAMRPPGEWNSYDIIWTAPKFDEEGTLTSPAYVTALHNGIVVLNHFELLGDTPYHRPPEYVAHEPKGPIALQDHGHPVRYRNIWIREFQPAQGKRVREPFLRNGDKETPVNR
jgi:hypothetical protein